MDNLIKPDVVHVNEMRLINRELTEKNLQMNCLTYLSKVKEHLLVETIMEIDSSKKKLEKMARDIEQQRDTIDKQRAELEIRNQQLKKLQKELEYRVTERTVELEQINEDLQQEIHERQCVEDEKRKMQEQLLHSQKMESVGRLAGGIAHDLNNLLMPILGYSQLALDKITPSCPLKKELNVILSAGEKGAALVRQLLAFSKKQKLEMKIINLNDVIKNMIRILDRMLGADLQIEICTEESLSNIKADVGQVEQVLLNLTVNARDAMPRGGRITIQTSNVVLDENFVKFHKGLTPGPYVLMTVTDTGQGMSPEIKGKIFDPFFTTKGKDKGTGLGLATVHGIIEQHKGHIDVSSEPGKGSTFYVYFKATDAEKSKKGHRENITIPTGTETILAVDDDTDVRNVLVDTLTSLGYDLLDAPDGEEALKLAQSTDKKIDLLITDIIMPGMNGKELKDNLVKIFPKIKVIFMTGYLDSIVSDYLGGESGNIFLQKPFSPSYLAGKIRMILDRESQG